MNRKQLEIDLAYAERDRLLSVGKVVTTTLSATSASGKLLPVEEVICPEWLKDGIQITAQGETPHTVLIVNERVCLLTPAGATQPVLADTAVLAARWQPLVA